jgi:PIN domain nuclease of toxin-antitoxin system
LLLDTHVVLWALGNVRMRPEAREAIEDTSTTVCVSAASAWELAIKSAIGKLRIPDDLSDQLRAARFVPLSITVEHALEVRRLDPRHGDPFDRLLVAQARAEDLTLVTRDTRLAAYGIPILAA